jgi:hypothetical protein
MAMTAPSALAMLAGLVAGAFLVTATDQIAAERQRPEAGANAAEAQVPIDKRTACHARAK